MTANSQLNKKKGLGPSLFSLTLLLRLSPSVSESKLTGVQVNLLLSLSLAHASQAAAARISKENSGLFKHPGAEARTHCVPQKLKNQVESNVYTEASTT